MWMTTSCFVTSAIPSFTFLRQFPRVSTIFRSTTIGHSDFVEKRLSEPLRAASDADVSERGGMYSNTKILFNWDKFQHQMYLAKSLVDSSFPEIIFVDVYASTARRADLHTVEDMACTTAYPDLLTTGSGCACCT